MSYFKHKLPKLVRHGTGIFRGSHPERHVPSNFIKEAINMAIHYVLAEIVMLYESGNSSVTWSIAGKNLDALHRLMLMCI